MEGGERDGERERERERGERKRYLLTNGFIQEMFTLLKP